MSIKKTGSLSQALNRLLIKKDQQHVKVGIIDGSKYPDGTSVASVGFWNEYGTKTAPSRPFFRSTIAEQKAQWVELTKKGIRAGMSVDHILGLVGAQMQTDIQSSIMTWTTPPNSAYTVAKKGFNAPLRNTMLMHDSIKFEVVE